MSIKNEDEVKHYWEILQQKTSNVIVVPSLLLDSDEEFRRIPGLVHKEERHLWSSLMLTDPMLRIFYFSSYPIDPTIVQYYLSTIPEISGLCDLDKIKTKEVTAASGGTFTINELVSGRFYNVCMNDMDELALADKIKKKYDDVIAHVRELMFDKNESNSYLLCYRTSPVEEKMAKELNMELIACNSAHDCWGSKSGSRKIFEEAGIACSPGTPLTHNKADLAAELHKMIDKENKRGKLVTKVVVKLDNFSAGGGNAVLDMKHLFRANGMIPTAEEIEKEFENMKLPYKDQKPQDFYNFIESIGAIAEAWVEGDELVSPSVQGIIAEGQVHIISTHGQILDGHEYTGCTFPADEDYRFHLTQLGQKVGEVLLKKGVHGHYGVDFVEKPLEGGGYESIAIEINLRCTGTTGPYVAMRLLTPGKYDVIKGTYTAQDGKEKFYVGSDGLKDDKLKGLSPSDFIEIINQNRELQWDNQSKKGALFHMLGAAKDYGKVGATFIANSQDEAKEMLDKAKEIIANI